MREQDFERGVKIAYRNMMAMCIRQLDTTIEDDPEKKVAILLAERDAAVSVLRDVCNRYGDNDWEDDLNLGDIIEKHLWRHMDAI